jgi:outer membrane protein insertion porin family
LRAAAGVSVFWDSPFGPVQFDFSTPLAYEPYDHLQQFRFSTRTSF